jgi:hypothetical protein
MTAPDMTHGLPDLATQLGTGSPTASDDCAAVTVCNVMLVLSHGKVGPKRQSEVAQWVHTVRVWGGAPLTLAQAKARGRDNAGMLLRGEVLRAYRSAGMSQAFSRAGLPAPRASYYWRADWKAVPTALANGYVIHLPVMYGVLRAGDAPIGSLTFSDGHSIALSGYRNYRRQVYGAEGDPLLDGRFIPGPTPGHYPDGWQTVRVPWFAKAASAWTGVKGQTTFIAVRRGA